MNLRWRWLALGLVALILGACSEVQFVMHTAKRMGKSDDASSGAYKVGKPYQIQGVWYYPQEDYDFDETGIASWYGPNFHGKKTANGEVFDQNQLTAAHRTLPMPSFVRVTNLENGRSLVVRVNDRGPFAHSRVIDLSRRSAQLLGFEKQGTARVRVQIMANESRALAARLRNETLLAEVGSPIRVEAMPKPKVSAESLPPPGGGSQPVQTSTQVASAGEPAAAGSWKPSIDNPVDSEVSVRPVGPTEVYVQAGAYSYFESANKVRASLSGIGPVQVTQVLVNGKDLYRVRVGPLVQVEQADRILDAVIRSGYPDARIIVEEQMKL